jgi:hypothetical protein
MFIGITKNKKNTHSLFILLLFHHFRFQPKDFLSQDLRQVEKQDLNEEWYQVKDVLNLLLLKVLYQLWLRNNHQNQNIYVPKKEY